jgi:Uma2 family endonuclease
VVLKDRHLTLEQFLELPERKPPLEYEDGQVTRKVSPKLKHVLLQRWLADRIDAAAPGSFVALPELRVTFGGQSCVPDVSVFQWGRLPVAADGEWVDDIFEPPDLVVKVVSPKQSVMRLLRRCIWYVRNGVGVALLVDGTDRSVVVLRLGTDPLAARGADAVDLTDVVPGLRFTASDLFSALRPG